ncbi:CTP-dependent riboflavin kinase [Candidatus Bathyarchaeota archaeon]|nr:MAG: CTP-dependent riboflavin kinase [Candidatus Bathyarchaeota archaeon]
MKPSHLLALYKLAEMGAYQRNVPYSTNLVAKSMGVSQQTASRRLIEMERLGLLTKSAEGRSQTVRITQEGLDSLTQMYRVLRSVFEAPRAEVEINAVVFSGLSEGAYYMGLEGYRKQFRSKLGFDPFPGTLNLRVRKEDLGARRELGSNPFVEIEGFANKTRTYGAVKGYRAIINGEVQGAVIVPVRAHYGEDVIEVISPEKLRTRFNLKDGDSVNIRVIFGA